MAVLYRKYRPQTFLEVVGQNHIKLTLEHEMKSDRLAHSYLFCGPRAVGKTTLARVMSKALNCENRKENEAEPCNTCQTCRVITSGGALDIIEIDAASNTGVDNVRENIIASTRVTPSSFKYKVFIIDEVHMLSASAFNALLKIMEEPPSYVVFILCTTEVHKIPMTIISRCQRFDFKKISIVDIVKKLQYIIKEEKIKIDNSILEAIARHSDGHMRDAESLLGQIVALGERKESGDLEITQEDAELVIPRNNLDEVITLIDYLSKKDTGKAIRLINKLVDDGYDLKIFTVNLIEILRQMILMKINPDLIVALSVNLGESVEAKLIEVNNKANINSLIRYIASFIKAKDELKTAFIIQLPLELAIIETTTENINPVTPKQPIQQSNGGQQINNPVATNNPSQMGQGINTQEKTPDRVTVSSSVSKVSFEEILNKWSEFLVQVKQSNHSLSFVLKSCKPVSVNGNELLLMFKHKIHFDKISEVKIRVLVEDVLKHVYGEPLVVKVEIDPNLEINSTSNADLKQDIQVEKPNEPAIDSLLKTLGGKIVS